MLCTVFKKYVPLLFSALFISCISTEARQTPQVVGMEKPAKAEQSVKTQIQAVEFDEVWVYVQDKQEGTLHSRINATDIGYFGAHINYRGHLDGVPDATKLVFYPARIHLVVTCNHHGMTHIVLSPDYPLRKKLIADLTQAAENKGYDGIQIDFEMVSTDDKEDFLSFLADLKQAFSEKGEKSIETPSDSAFLQKTNTGTKQKKRIVSAAFPARTKKLEKDAYDYERAAAVVDRLFVMAYDEHWSRGKPGPVASFDWCRNIASYALETVGTEKLIMGQPFYGRTWGSVNANRAFYHSGMERQIREFGVQHIEEDGGAFRFSYTIPLEVTAYFDNANSIAARSLMYKNMGVLSTGFWCLGQEDPAVWDYIYCSTVR